MDVGVRGVVRAPCVYGFRAYAIVEMEHCSHVTLYCHKVKPTDPYQHWRFLGFKERMGRRFWKKHMLLVQAKGSLIFHGQKEASGQRESELYKKLYTDKMIVVLDRSCISSKCHFYGGSFQDELANDANLPILNCYYASFIKHCRVVMPLVWHTQRET
ncbi:hypothetical protein NC652_002510 [Populus alba x Populus x berolinensis]|uniref:Uncharacterized protein n=1 Tax=Populus alba x Populus x berolinensis TaxID=444605 RepID=A0AAD6RP72_9ROSI|nr:hypothetical protein NC652_002510 [Populus alba x Populus x berolinensis]KAJ7012571.1 hypothetical protein NC653_002579 [Populus alba x Populus x berolinensis]